MRKKLFCLYILQTNQRYSLTSLDKSGHTWPHRTNSITLRYLSLVTIFTQNLYNIDCFLPEILMVYESSNLLGREQILVNQLKVYVIHDKNTFFLRIQLIFPSKLLQCDHATPWSTKFTPGKSKNAWKWLGTLGHAQPAVIA